ncbi:MAG TPA: hypothetical protein VFR23_01620 [Jiangellaceae bacterium]|nr:hypothetical protein [Jiangellaceae bacterium]
MTTAIPTHSPTIKRPQRFGFGRALSAEWTKLRTVRSTAWTLASLVLVSIGLTALMGWLAAAELATGEAGEPVGAFVTWGPDVRPDRGVRTRCARRLIRVRERHDPRDPGRHTTALAGTRS